METLTKFNRRNAYLIAGAFGFFVMLALLLIFFNSISQSEQKEYLTVTNDYIEFQEQVNTLINSNILLLNGYSAYIASIEDEVTEEQTLAYLDALTKDQRRFIRNVGIIKDTTIIYNYPKEGNEAAIGIDLAQIDGQKETVLRAKNRLTPVLTGPIELVQGGKAFIVRLPILDKAGDYWGQISIVLKADVMVKEIESFAKGQQLHAAIKSNEEGAGWILGDETIFDENPIEFTIHTNLLNWQIYVVQENGWTDRTLRKVLSVVAAMLAMTATTGITFYALKANYQIRHNSYHDNLTNLYNRHFFDEYQIMVMGAASRNGEKFGLILVDLNDFKAINDTYGHKVGDLVLVETARLLIGICRVNEAVFRLGGDEFLLVVPRLISEDELLVVKDRIEKAFYQEFDVKGYNIEMIPSIGIAAYPGDGESFDEVLHHADTHMYEEKYLTKLNTEKR